MYKISSNLALNGIEELIMRKREKLALMLSTMLLCIIIVSNATDAAGYAIIKFIPVDRYNVTVYFPEKSWSKVFDIYNNSAFHCCNLSILKWQNKKLSTIFPSSSYINMTWAENITEEVIKIGSLSIPKTIFFAFIIGIGVPVAGIALFYTYRYFRVPKVLRTLNKIISKVKKGERIPLDAVANVRSRRDIVNEKVNKLWRKLGIKLSSVREEGKESG